MKKFEVEIYILLKIDEELIVYFLYFFFPKMNFYICVNIFVWLLLIRQSFLL